MTAITTHVLDTARGRPARGLWVMLERVGPEGDGTPVGRASTDPDGRIRSFGGEGLGPGRYRLCFETGRWFAAEGLNGFFPQVVVDFEISAGTAHQHVPLLLSPFGYSTYRGS